MRRTFAVALATGAVALLAAGCGSQVDRTAPESEPAPAPSTSEPPSSLEGDAPADLAHKIGETVSVTMTDENNYVHRVNITVNSVKDAGATISDSMTTYRAKNGRYLVFTVTYEAEVNTADYAFNDWTVLMPPPDGKDYGEATLTVETTKWGQPLAMVGTGTLRQGRRVSGIVTFDVPKAHGTIVYVPAYYIGETEPLEEWSF
jgi:hypothetical protein